MVAGLRGSSSGIPTSTLPTRSAPTSAALVYIPPPTLAKRACVDAPIPNVSIVVVIIQSFAAGLAESASITLSRRIYQKEMSNRPSPTTTSPITAPLRKATRNPRFNDIRAALAVRAEAYVAVFIPRYPDSPEKNPPVRKATGTQWF